MKKLRRLYKIWFLLAVAALFQTCVEPVAFDRRQEDTILVVDGKVSLNDSVQMLLLTRTEAVGRSARFPPETGAIVILLENDKTVATYQEEEPGIYKVYNFKPQVGNTYQVDIKLQTGERYLSSPEIMPRSVRMDSAYFIYNGDRTLTLFSRTQIPKEGTAPYLRWRIKQVYQHTDQHCGGLDNVEVCYYELNRATDNQLVPLLDGGELEPGAIVETPVATASVMDSVFGEITFYTIFQETLTPTTFQYWQKVNTLLTQTGSIFDAPPGQIRGNIFNVEEPNALVLGLFYATAEEVAYVKTFPIDFAPLNLQPYCGVPGIFSNPFPSECCVCPFGIPRPDYWK